MKKNLKFTAILLMLVGCFTSCSKEDIISDKEGYVQIMEAPLSVKVTNLKNEHIAFAKFYVTYYNNGEWPHLEFSTNYGNDGFELDFPATIPDEYLQSASNNGVPLSDIQAKIVSVHIDAHNVADENIGGFSFRSDKWGIEFKYADRDFIEKGISEYGVEFDCSYKKGWNVVYCTSDGGVKRTTQKPLNEEFKCYFSYNRVDAENSIIGKWSI